MRNSDWLKALGLTVLLFLPVACGAPEAVDEAPAPEVAEEAAEGDAMAPEVEAPADPYNLAGREILIGTDPTYPPFESEEGAGGEIVGVDPDLMTAICEIVNCVPKFQGTSWDGIFAALAAGEFDALMSAITILPEREESSNATFTDPYFSIGQVILVRGDETEIAGVDDLAAAVVGVQNGTTGDTAATDADVPDENLRRFDAIALAIQALLNGDIDCVVLDSAPAEKAVATGEAGTLRIAGDPFTREDYGILVPNSSPELLEAFNHAIARLSESGKLDRIVETWMAADEASDEADAAGEDAAGDEEAGEGEGDDSEG